MGQREELRQYLIDTMATPLEIPEEESWNMTAICPEEVMLRIERDPEFRAAIENYIFRLGMDESMAKILRKRFKK